MNISAKEFENDVEVDVSFRHRGAASGPVASSRQRRSFSRRRKGPQQFNGIHRRRRKKIRW